MVEYDQLEVTPAMAEEWLRNKAPNGKPRAEKVFELTQKMLDGRWCPDGLTIHFDSEDRLRDGQHRLLAVICAGIPVLMRRSRRVK